MSRLVVAAATLTLVTACGSTVQTSHELGGAAGALGPQGAPALGVAASHLGPVGTASAEPGRVAEPGPAAGGATGPGSPTSTAPVNSSVLSGPGFDATHVYLGIEYTSDFNTFASSAGFGSLTSGNDQALASALVSYVNAHGGVLGRTVVPVWHDTSTASAESDPQTASQATCAAFTDDKRVFAAVTISGAYSCLANRRVPTAITGSSLPVDSALLDRFAPNLYAPAGYVYDRLTPLWLDRLQAQGYFPRGAKIGLFYGDVPGTNEPADAHALEQALRARGIDVAATFEYDGSNAGAATTSAPRAVLPFRAANVDHVMGLDANVGLFMIAAEQQAYRPRYAINSYLNPATALQAVAPAAQLKGAVGVGWEPVNDVDASQQTPPGPPGSPACDRLVASTGQRPAGSARFILASYCDSVLLLLRAAEAGGGFAPSQVRSGAARLGAAFPSALTFRAAYSTSRSDGGSVVRDLRYDEGCACFRYVDATLHE